MNRWTRIAGIVLHLLIGGFVIFAAVMKLSGMADPKPETTPPTQSGTAESNPEPSPAPHLPRASSRTSNSSRSANCSPPCC